MKRTFFLPSRAWQCIALTCLLGAFASGQISGRQPAFSPSATHDSIPAIPLPSDSLRMLAVYTGTYTIPDDPDLTIVLENGKLYGIPASGNKHLMVRTGQHQFYVPEKKILMQFEMDSNGKVAALQLTKGDESVPAMKKK